MRFIWLRFLKRPKKVAISIQIVAQIVSDPGGGWVNVADRFTSAFADVANEAAFAVLILRCASGRRLAPPWHISFAGWPLIDRPDAVAIYCGVAFLASILTFQLFKISKPMSRYFSAGDAMEVAKACLISVSIAGAFLFTFTRMEETPRSIPLIHYFVLDGRLDRRPKHRPHSQRLARFP